MGAEAAIKPVASPAQDQEPENSRSARFSAISGIIELYHDLTRALAQTRDAELAHLAAASREGKHALDEWARQIEEFRGFKWRVEAGVHPADRPPPARATPAAAQPAATLDEGGIPPLVLEALAFFIGFVMSLLIM
jgi:hypothetical protein